MGPSGPSHHCSLHSLVFSYQGVKSQPGKSRFASPQREIKHPGQISGQAYAASAEAFQTGFDPFHFMQKTVELGQS